LVDQGAEVEDIRVVPAHLVEQELQAKEIQVERLVVQHHNMVVEVEEVLVRLEVMELAQLLAVAA
jgi:predicted nucleotidyltransferase